MIKTYIEAISFIEKYIPASEKKHMGELGLYRMKYLVKLLGNPQLQYPTIHVGGTSGKGSTATFITSILATKYKVGLYTSPHLVDVRERIKIIEKYKAESGKRKEGFWTSQNDDADNICSRDFIDLINVILTVIDQMKKTKYGSPTYFEIITAMAFLYFQVQKVDIAVIEVGLGGWYDATNMVRPLIAVFTNVGLDHTEILGSTIEEIAKEKVEIIKKNMHVISGVSQPSIVKIVQDKCFATGSELLLLSRDFSYQIKKIDLRGGIFDYSGDNIYKDLKISMLGEHQVQNASIAIKAIEILNSPPTPRGYRESSRFRRARKFQIPNSYIRKGLKYAYIPGRCEIVKSQPLVIFDGAHNADKMKALVGTIRKVFPEKKVTVILAIKKDKNAREMISVLVPITNRIVLTEYELVTDQGVITSYHSEDLQDILLGIGRNIKINIMKDPVQAMNSVIKEIQKDSLILVTGSLYLIREIKKNYYI